MISTCVTRIFVEPIVATLKEQGVKTYFSRFGNIIAFELVDIILPPSSLSITSNLQMNIVEHHFYKITFSSYLPLNRLEELIKQPHSIENQSLEVLRIESSLYESSLIAQGSDVSLSQVSSTEEAYYEECKQYYHITRTPLISISDEIFNNNTELKTISLKFSIDEDYNEFNVEEFLTKISSILDIERSDIEIRKILKGCIILETIIYKKFNLNEIQIKIKILYDSLTNKVREELGKLKIFFMFMGNIITLNQMQKFRNEIQLHPQWNRIYNIGHTNWDGALQDGRDRGPHPYYCPIGWQRYALYVTDKFDERFQGWCVCYHGTKFSHGLSILLSGLKPAQRAQHGKGIYVSPSIIYASHPRYSEIKYIDSSDEKKIFKNGKYVQFVLQCRVHPNNIETIKDETLDAKRTTIDSNVNNDVIEWVINAKDKDLMDFNDPNSTIVCTGLMVRVTDNHPGLLDESQWWYESHLCNRGTVCCDLGIDLNELKKQKENEEKCNIVFE